MRTLLRKLFLENWQRKLISVFLAVIIWFMVNQSLITSRVINNIPIRIINIPEGKTVVDLQSNGTLAKRTSLTLVGNKALLDELSLNDLEVVIDAQNKQGEWIATISRRNLISLNPDLNLSKGITRTSETNVIIRLTKLVSEKIPVFITQPIGQAPTGYQYLDIWPYQLRLNISGPEDVVKRLKSKGIRLTFDLSDITKAELDALRARPDSAQGDEVSYFVPEQWKRVSIPLLSEAPIEIDDPRAKNLRVDFVRISLLPINSKIPVSLYFPTENLNRYNPKNISLTTGPLIQSVGGLDVFAIPLYAKGVSPLFVRIVENMLKITITIDPSDITKELPWSIEFINSRLLEDRYVSIMMSDISDSQIHELQPLDREEYLRNRFRSYMNRFRLYKSEDERLRITAKLTNDKVSLEEGTAPLPNSSKILKE
ncbi:MAG: hypothetical protein KR126chlam1_00334 [Chlamydiae bacterium]|nr:hypothetical protein [Chlamydiota bacterium]